MSVSMIQETGVTNDDNDASVAFGVNVTAGDTVIVAASAINSVSDAFIAGDCTKSAGTATIGAITLVHQAQVDLSGWSSGFIANGIWVVQVTGTGSCTMRVTNANAIAVNMGIGQYRSTVGAITADAGQTASNSAIPGSSLATGNVTTARNGVIIGVMGIDGSGTPTNTPDAAFTVIKEEENGNLHWMFSSIRRLTTGSVADSADWALGASNACAGIAAAFSEPAAGGGSIGGPVLDGRTFRGLTAGRALG